MKNQNGLPFKGIQRGHEGEIALMRRIQRLPLPGLALQFRKFLELPGPARRAGVLEHLALVTRRMVPRAQQSWMHLMMLSLQAPAASANIFCGGIWRNSRVAAASIVNTSTPRRPCVRGHRPRKPLWLTQTLWRLHMAYIDHVANVRYLVI